MTDRIGGRTQARLAFALGAAMALAGCEGASQFGRSAPAAPPPAPLGSSAAPVSGMAMARQGETVADVALRVGADPQALADFNGLFPNYRLRAGEMLALPEGGVAGAAGNRDIAAIAGGALQRADGGSAEGGIRSAPLDGSSGPFSASPSSTLDDGTLRHRVASGETAFSIADLYGVSPRTLAEWNNLGPDFAVREGQSLIIPPGNAARAAPAAVPAPPPVAAPGTPSAVAPPPSASDPLPREAAAPPAPPPSPGLGSSQSPAGAPRGFLRPVDGAVLRGYGTGGNEGIDFSAAPGSTVRAAADGEVALISRATGESLIVLVRHPDNIYTVYSNVTGAQVEKGQSVSRGQPIARVVEGSPGFVHFEVRRGTQATDPGPLLE
ncbi:MAG: peptidase M23 [Alphaproteobacteria bacterium HGW-Alphaproteobacteria-2]|nr:MAG: peptidase M23 [Alphaproteobacteria bacterium HGW-Alphaproteobacteria-2]